MTRALSLTIDTHSQFDEDRLDATELFDAPPAADSSAVAGQVRQALARGDHVAAIQAGLSCADTDPNPVLSCLSAVKSTDITQVLDRLPVDDLDVLMRAIYKGLAAPQDNNCAVLLSWHEKVVEIGGEGVIVRVLTHRA